jgi:prepilin-type N-terminal cleavage/methylation domain-containing protein
MTTRMGRCWRRGGFTLVEMLTTIAIIAIVLALIVPAISLVQKTAVNVKQKTQFHTVGIALEGFRSDFGDYPPSKSETSGPAFGYCGAQKLAEAIVGWDGFGVHPLSQFLPSGRTLAGEEVYNVNTGITWANSYTETADENRKARKGPYLELESANAVRISDLYDSRYPRPDNPDTFVLSDMFGKVKHLRTQKNTGMPILYFKANINGLEHNVTTAQVEQTGGAMTRRVVYNVYDNEPIFKERPPFDRRLQHWPNDRVAVPPRTVGQTFYDRTLNPNFPGPPATVDPPRPYRSESFILLSAGPDGLYGTADDVYNFDTEK